MNVLLTGASGFLGGALITCLLRHPSARRIVAVSRWENASYPAGIEPARVPGYGRDTDWRPQLRDIDVVIHAAARVHQAENGPDALSDFRRINTAGTLDLARQAAEGGVRRLVFLSTVKVNGEATAPGHPFKVEDAPAPIGPYAVSKREAEDGLRALSRETGLEVVIVRPPLVYGPGVGANFLRLVRWVDRGLPLPVPYSRGAAPNLRSLIGVDNLADALVRCAEHPEASGETFLVSDGEDVSTEDLARRIARELGRPARFVSVPPAMMRVLPGGEGLRRRLFDSLQVDASPIRERLGWTPPSTLDAGLAETVHWYRARDQST